MSTRQKTAPTPLLQQRDLGRIEVLPQVVAAIAGNAALECYGVRSMAARNLREGISERLQREDVRRGVEVRTDQDGISVDLYVVVQYGIRISEVAHNLMGTVRFALERMLGLPVTAVNVFVQGVHDDAERPSPSQPAR
ncbi:MAG: Asp23/Gls24 family envelope stress response protein [Candidatus Dormibacteria bacterium]